MGSLQQKCAKKACPEISGHALLPLFCFTALLCCLQHPCRPVAGSGFPFQCHEKHIAGGMLCAPMRTVAAMTVKVNVLPSSSAVSVKMPLRTLTAAWETTAAVCSSRTVQWVGSTQPISESSLIRSEEMSASVPFASRMQR